MLSGYADWRDTPAMQGVTIAEFWQGFQMPALYNSLRRNADGLRNPVTGENDGISAVYDLEGVPAFVTPPTPAVASTAARSPGRRTR